MKTARSAGSVVAETGGEHGGRDEDHGDRVEQQLQRVHKPSTLRRRAGRRRASVCEVAEPAQGAQAGHEAVLAAAGDDEPRQAAQAPRDRPLGDGEVAGAVVGADDRVLRVAQRRRTRRRSSTRTGRTRTAARGARRRRRTSARGRRRRPRARPRAAAGRRRCRAGSSGAAATTPATAASRGLRPADVRAGRGLVAGRIVLLEQEVVVAAAGRRRARDRRAAGRAPAARRCASAPSSSPPAAPRPRGSVAFSFRYRRNAATRWWSLRKTT